MSFRLKSFYLAAGILVLAASLPAPAGAERPNVETLSPGSGLPSPTLFDLAQDASGRIWIASRAGVTVYDGRSFQTYSTTEGLANRGYEELEIDATGRIWTVTKSRIQVFYRDRSAWVGLPRSPHSGLDFNWATSLAVIPEDSGILVAVGTTLTGLEIWDGESWSRFTVDEGLPSNHVTSLAWRENRLTVGTRSGMCAVAARQLDCRLAELDPRLGEGVLALLADPHGQGLWILGSTWLGRLEDGRLTVVTEDFKPIYATPSMKGAIAIDRAGGVFFGSPAQVYFLESGERRPLPLGIRNGLIAEGVTTLLVDREDNVWIGGLRGLSKIDSFRFLSYDRRSGLLENEVTAIAESPPGRIIFGHDTGLSFLEGDRVRTAAFAPEITDRSPDSTRVLDIAVGDGGEVWVTARELGLLRLGEGASWETVLDCDAVAVEIDSRGRLWVSSWDAVYRRDPDRWTGLDLEAELGVRRGFRWLAAAPDGRMFLATDRGLVWQEEEAWRQALGPTDESNNVYNVLAEPAGTVWVGTLGGLYELRGRELVKVDRDGLSIDRPVYVIAEDDRGKLWFGTDDGVRVWDGVRLRHFTVRHGLAGRETNRGAGFVDHRGRVWIGTEQGASLYRELYDEGPGAAPSVEIRGVEVDGELRPLTDDVVLSHRHNALTFQVDTISFSREEEVLCRYRLAGSGEAWQGPAPCPRPLRYTHLPPGDYRLQVATGWTGGLWSDELTSARVVILSPWWRRWWFFAAATAAVALAIAGGHGLRTRSIRARARELESLNAELHRQMAERRRAETERESVIAELEKRNAELERFTYTVSHDLKSPLITINAYLGLLEKDAEAGDRERARADYEHIKGAVKQMGRLLEELLELSRVGRLVHPSEKVALGDLTRQAADLVVAKTRAGHFVRLEIAADLPVILGDRLRLLEVLQNLLENAVKYMDEQREPRIEVGVRRAGSEQVFFVRDNGRGIPAEYQEKIFGLFERLDQETEGTGVGLALVKRIVELHGGRIWVESEGAGKGSTFCFTLSSTDSADDFGSR